MVINGRVEVDGCNFSSASVAGSSSVSDKTVPSSGMVGDDGRGMSVGSISWFLLRSRGVGTSGCVILISSRDPLVPDSRPCDAFNGSTSAESTARKSWIVSSAVVLLSNGSVSKLLRLSLAQYCEAGSPHDS